MNTPYPMIFEKTLKSNYSNLLAGNTTLTDLLNPFTAIKKLKTEKNEVESIYMYFFNYFQNNFTKYYNEIQNALTIPLTKEFIYEECQSLSRSSQLIYTWQQSKQVYTFNPNLLDIVTSADASNIPADILLQKLPFDCFFVQNKFFSNTGREYVGFYAVKDHNVGGNICFDITFLAEEKRAEYTTHFLSNLQFELHEGENKSIDELAFEAFERSGAFNQTDHNMRKERMAKAFYDEYEITKQALNCILYLCSDKVDVVRTKQEYKSTDAKDKNKRPKKVNVDLVGNETAKIIRENKVRYRYVNDDTVQDGVSNDNINNHSTPKSPHMRRAHFHSYWCGAHNSPDRHLEIKLLSPILVKGGGDKDVTTIRKVSLPPNWKRDEDEENDDEELDLTGNKNKGL